MQKKDVVWLATISGYLILDTIFFNTNWLKSIDWMTQAYRAVGFSWPMPQGNTFSTLLIYSFFLCSLNQMVKGIIFGWPNFKEHDINSLRLCFLRLLGYGGLVFIAISLFGLRLKAGIMFNYHEYGLIALAALIFGGIIVVIDDFLGSIYIFITEK